MKRGAKGLSLRILIAPIVLALWNQSVMSLKIVFLLLGCGSRFLSEVMPLKKKTWSFMSGLSRISLAQLKMVMMVIGGCSLQLRCGGFGDGATRGKTRKWTLCSLEIMHSRSSLLGPRSYYGWAWL